MNITIAAPALSPYCRSNTTCAASVFLYSNAPSGPSSKFHCTLSASICASHRNSCSSPSPSWSYWSALDEKWTFDSMDQSSSSLPRTWLSGPHCAQTLAHRCAFGATRDRGALETPSSLCFRAVARSCSCTCLCWCRRLIADPHWIATWEKLRSCLDSHGAGNFSEETKVVHGCSHRHGSHSNGKGRDTQHFKLFRLNSFGRVHVGTFRRMTIMVIIMITEGPESLQLVSREWHAKVSP